ncbi:MAG: lysophospholipid acyltransferase family protein, partial [Thermodesulfobacteriota bacterium]
PYLRRRFPLKSRAGRWLDTFRLVHSFGKILVDRAWLGLKKKASLKGEFYGQSRLQEIIREENGVILVTAHVGNWQTALAHLNQLPTRVHSLMHYDQKAVARHYFDLKNWQRPFRIIPNNGFLGGMIEATAALQRGEIVTVMGDRYAGGPKVKVEFLGNPVRLPATPYILAACTSVPVIVLFTAKTGNKSYTIKIWDIFQPVPADRHNRNQEMRKWGQRFASSLENYLAQHPYQWYNFYDFWKQ